MFKFIAITCLAVCWISSQAYAATVVPKNDVEKKIVDELSKAELSDAETEKMIAVHRRYSTSGKTLEDKRIESHNICQAFDLGHQTIKFPESPERKQFESKWKTLERTENLQGKVRFWNTFDVNKDTDMKGAMIALKNACMLYNEAYNAAKEDEKPNAAELF